MSEMPADPFEHPQPLWNYLGRGALLLEQLMTMDPRRAFYTVMRDDTLSRDELASVALVALSDRWIPNWRERADAERQTA